MKYLEDLQRKKVFNLEYAKRLTGNELTAKSLLLSYKKAGYIQSVRRNLYVALDLASKTPLANRFEIGSAANQGAYISHHSALEYHGVANQVFYTITVSSFQPFQPFDYNGISYGFCNAKIESGVTSPGQMPGVKVTDIERTVADCIFDIDRAGGTEEIIESLKLLPMLDEEKLLSYLNEYHNIFLWQKTGYLLENLKDHLRISDVFLNECKSHIHNRKKYLDRQSDMVYKPAWKLYVPNNLFTSIDEGGDFLV